MLIQLPDEQRERIEALARERGYATPTDYVLALIDADASDDEFVGEITSKNMPQALRDILATTPKEEVIAKIEALNPPWKKDLLPWQIVQPGDSIPWQAVYVLWQEPATPEVHEWARQKLVKLGYLKDA
jgi:hypothetical protein